MIDFRSKDAIPSSLAALLSIFVLLGGLIFQLFYPRPSAGTQLQRASKDKAEIIRQIGASRERLKEGQATLEAATWPGTADKIAPVAFARLSSLATRHKVKLTALRPQRTGSSGDLETLPFQMTVEGPYAAVVEMTREIETPSSRLAVNVVQISWSDTGNDSVTANVGIIAYLRPSMKTVDASGGKTNRA